MRVTMTQGIGGYRNGVPWPAKGEEIDLPVAEALDLIRANYARASEPDQALAIAIGAVPDTAGVPAVPDLKKAKKPELIEFIEARGLDVDMKLGVREMRRAVAELLEEHDDETDTPEPDGDSTGPAGGTGPQVGEATGEPRVQVGLDELDKGQLLDLAANLNVSVNPALDVDEIRAVLAAAGVMGELVSVDGPPADPLEV
jgi:hypothetical protein